MTPASYPKAAPYRVAVSLSIKPKDYLREMSGAKFSGMTRAGEALPGLCWAAPPHRDMAASVLGDMADFAARCESAGAVLGFEMPEEHVSLQAFDYLWANEWSGGEPPRAFDEDRDSHVWLLYIADDGSPAVVFHHGKFGMRKQSFASLSVALSCLRDLVAGQPWEEFGDEDSRRTLLHKGQFYWDTPREATPIPIDNFVFETDEGHRWRIAACGSQSILSWKSPNGRTAHTWNDDHAQSLDTLAAILAGDLSANDFHAEELVESEAYPPKGNELATGENPDYSPEFQATRWIPAAVEPLTASASGAIYVMNIFNANDRFQADCLAYLTKQGHKVQLRMGVSSWVLTAQNPDGPEFVTTISAKDKPAAFRALARALRGQAWC
jgi:hypothetical protein